MCDGKTGLSIDRRKKSLRHIIVSLPIHSLFTAFYSLFTAFVQLRFDGDTCFALCKYYVLTLYKSLNAGK